MTNYQTTFDHAVKTAWNRLNRPTPIAERLHERLHTTSRASIVDYFLRNGPHYELLVDGMPISSDVSARVDSKTVALSLTNSLAEESALRAKADTSGLHDKQTGRSNLDILPFQETLLEHGKILIRSPFDGAVNTSNQSLFAQGEGNMFNFILYRFVSCGTVYYLITGGWSGQKMGLYFPIDNVILTNSNRLYNALHYSLAALSASILLDQLSFVDYVTSKEAKQIGVCLSFSKHFGHSIMADLSGLYASMHILLARSSCMRFVVGGFCLLDPFKLLDFSSEVRCLSIHDAFSGSLRDNLVLVRPTRTNKICSGFEAFLRRYSHQHRSESSIELANKCSKHNLVLYFSLRSGRTWNNQVEGIISVFTSLLVDYPNALLLLDGPTALYECGDETRHSYPESAMVQSIMNELPCGSCLSIVGCTLPDKINIVSLASFYIVPFGSNYVIPLILRKKGIILASNELAKGGAIEKELIAYRPNSCVVPIVMVDTETGLYEDDETGKAGSESYLHSGMFAIDWNLLLTKCRELAKALSLQALPLL